jgi:hypothetical protein
MDIHEFRLSTVCLRSAGEKKTSAAQSEMRLCLSKTSLQEQALLSVTLSLTGKASETRANILHLQAFIAAQISNTGLPDFS